jgi:hypothetical protein
MTQIQIYNPNMRVQNLSCKIGVNDHGFQYEKIYYEIVNRENEMVNSIQDVIFFENSHGIIFQISGEKFQFKDDLIDILVNSSKFYEPFIEEISEINLFVNELTGFEFEYSKNWRIVDSFDQGIPQITLTKQGSDTYGVIIVEIADPNFKMNQQKYVEKNLENIKNLKQLSQGQWDSHNIMQQSMTNSNGFKYECIEYDLVDPFDSTMIFEKVKQCIFFENNHGYILQNVGPSYGYNPDFINEIVEQIKFRNKN